MNPVLASMGGPDVVHVLVHCIGSIPNRAALRCKLSTLDYYPERALLMARPQDVVCVHHPVDSGFFDFLERMGLGPNQKNVIACADATSAKTPDLPSRLLGDAVALRRIADRVRGFERVVLHPLYASHRMFDLGDALSRTLGSSVGVIGGNPEVVYNASLKDRGKAIAIELGIPAPPGELVELTLSAGEYSNLADLRGAIEHRMKPTGRAIIRGVSGSSGSATFLAGDNAESIDAVVNTIAARRDNRTYLVEACFDNIASPNIQVFVDPAGAGISPPIATDQVLDAHLKHSGNAYPSRAQTLPRMFEAVRKLAGRLRDDGFSGTAGVDCVEYLDPTSGERKWFLAEINPRINAAAYPVALMHRLNSHQACDNRIKAFHAATIRTSARSFAELTERCGHLFFDPNSGRGLFPYNIGCLSGGTFDAAFLGQSREEVEGMVEELMRLNSGV